MQGYSDIDVLKLSTIRGYYELFTADPDLRLVNMFPTGMSETDEIKWDSHVAGRGMVPFKGPGQETPMGYTRGISQNSAKVAMFGQKRYYDEEFLNNLRQPGTTAQKMVATQKLAKEQAEMGNMSMRRREWMFAQMMVSNGFTYKSTGDTTITVDYGIPSSHRVTVSAAKSWYDGADATILADFNTANRTVRDACGATIVRAISNSSVLEYISADSDILTLLSKSTFGNGDLFSGNVNELINANPSVIGNLFHKNLTYEVYDEQYEVRANITSAVTASSTTVISVDDAADFVAGGTLTFVDVSAGTSESETIASVDEDAGTVTVSSAPST
ncbi:MAG: major capsid protein, partial [Methanosarcinaceae archaeon]|nr:major capsid protein [Methanosarcinaceae archaeon]